MKSIFKDTRTIFSISSKPGIFGSRLYPELFAEYGLNISYQTLAVSCESHLMKIFDLFRLTDEFHGLSISMPYKYAAGLAFPDRHGSHPEGVNSVNTVVKTEKGIYSCSTDISFFDIFSERFRMPVATVFIYGDGAMGSMACGYFSKYGHDTVVIRRGELDKFMPLILESTNCYFVNCTPARIEDIRITPSKSCIVLDLPVRYNHPYEEDQFTMTGYTCAMVQLRGQFEIYTGIRIDLALVEDVCSRLFY